MKDIKSMIIGFLLATCMFLFMGFRAEQPAGTYQLLTDNNGQYYIFNTRAGLFEGYYANEEGQHMVTELDKIMSE